MNQYKCGACSHGEYRIYHVPNGDMITECMNCGSITRITIRANIALEWDDNSDGKMCLGWGTECPDRG